MIAALAVTAVTAVVFLIDGHFQRTVRFDDRDQRASHQRFVAALRRAVQR